MHAGDADLLAIAEAMRHEYEAIAASGAMLQIDCPDLAMGRHTQFKDLDVKGFRAMMELNIEAMNRALVNIPADKVRMHLCWGNYPGPHHFDIPLQDIVDIVWKAKPHAIQFEAALRAGSSVSSMKAGTSNSAVASAASGAAGRDPGHDHAPGAGPVPHVVSSLSVAPVEGGRPGAPVRFARPVPAVPRHSVVPPAPAGLSRLRPGARTDGACNRHAADPR